MAKEDMDLRDWFAGQALKGLLGGPNAPKKSGTEAPDQYALRVAEEAYLFADAMMREGEKPPVADEEIGEAEPPAANPSPRANGGPSAPTVRVSSNYRHPASKEWVGTAALQNGRLERTLDIPEEAYQAIESEVAAGGIEGSAILEGGVRFDWFLDR